MKLTLRYSMNRLRNATKCSALRMFPGTASSSMSLDNTANFSTLFCSNCSPGLAIISSSSRASFACCKPDTSFSYSFCNLSESVFLILNQINLSRMLVVTLNTHSSILSPILLTLLAAESNIGLVKSTDSDSMHTLSAQVLSQFFVRRKRLLTDIVRLIEDHNALLTHLGRDLLCDFWIKQIVKRIDHNVEVRQLNMISSCRPSSRQTNTHHAPNREIGTNAFLLAILLHVV